MQKKWIFCVGILTGIYCTEPLFLYSMSDDNSSYIIRLLPKELQEYILLSEDIGFFKDTISFLGAQPITLAKPDMHMTAIESIALYGDILETKSWCSWRWHTVLWNIHTGKFIHANTEICKPWEEYCSVTLDNNKALSIVPVYHLNKSPKSTTLWDTQTNQKLKIIDHARSIKSMTADGNCVVMVLNNGQIKVWNTDNKSDSHIINPHGIATSAAIKKNIIAIGFKTGAVEIRNRDTRDLIHCFIIKSPQKITAMTIHDNKILAGYRNGTAKIWDIITRKLLHTLAGPNQHTDIITSMVMDSNIVATGSEDCTIKIWPLKVNVLGTIDDNPLLWIMYNANAPQLNFIWRAWQATQTKQEFIISLPIKLGTIEQDESPEQTDGRTYFTLPPMIREYLKNRLKIRRQATTLDKIRLAFEEIMTAL